MGKYGIRMMAGLAAILAGPASAAPAGDGEPPPRVFADFESEESPSGFDVVNSTAERIALDGGTVLRWSLPAQERASWIVLEGLPEDLSPFRGVRMRIRLEGAERPGLPQLRVKSSLDDYAHATLHGIGQEWRTMEFEFPRMWKSGAFDPKKGRDVELIVWGPKAGAFLVDDVVLLPTRPGSGESADRGETAKPWKDDFEDPEVDSRTDSWKCVLQTNKGNTPSGKACLRLEFPADRRNPGFDLHGIPQDLRPYRVLRFLARASPALEVPLTVRLQSGGGRFLEANFHDIKPQWNQFSVEVPAMSQAGEFDPTMVQRLAFIVFDSKAAAVSVDRVELLPGPGGWEFTQEQKLAHYFGKDRASKTAKIATTHFDVFTDSRAAQSKFPEALERAYEFVKKTLGTPEMTERLPVYIFQSSTLYWDFCVRVAGWSRAEAEKSGGHGSGRYFATYYQAPEAPVIVHELTHSIFIRMVGRHGGSWFHEGVAQYVENLWQKRDPAREFAPRLRGGKFFPLRKFLALTVLLDQEDLTGGAATAENLYFQAGAFWEFLARGPLKEAWARAQPVVATSDADSDAQPKLVERLLGTTMEKLEKAWVDWGSKPPE